MSSNFSPMYFEQPIVIFDTTESVNSTTGSFVLYGGVSINAAYDTLDTSSGAFVLSGGMAVQKDVSIGGIQHIYNVTESTGINDGALIVDGGVGIAKNLHVGGDATILGNLFVQGTYTYVNTQTINVEDNTLVINAGPAGSGDGGVLIHRAGSDVTLGASVTSGTLSAVTQLTVTLPLEMAQSDNHYRGWWVKTSDGTAQITSYTASNRVAALATSGNTLPSSPTYTTFDLYNKSYLAQYYAETQDEVRFAYVADATDTNYQLENFDNYADVRLKSLFANTSVSTASIYTSGLSTIANLAVTNLLVASVSMENAALKSATIGNLYVTGESVLRGAVTAGALAVTGDSILQGFVTAGALAVTGESFLRGAVTAGALNVTGDSILQGFVTAGSLNVTGDSILENNLTVTTGNVIISTNDYSPILNSTPASGSIIFNTVDVSPSLGDISRERIYNTANAQAAAANITGFSFSNSVVRAFDAIVSVTILTTDNTNKYSYYNLKGVQKSGNWVVNSSYVGDATGYTFSVTNSGQIQYTSTSVGNYSSSYVSFRALTTSILS